MDKLAASKTALLGSSPGTPAIIGELEEIDGTPYIPDGARLVYIGGGRKFTEMKQRALESVMSGKTVAIVRGDGEVMVVKLAPHELKK